MSDIKPRPMLWPKFSLLHLLTLTLLIAISVAVTMAYRKNQTMVQYRDDLLSLSSRMHPFSDDKLSLVEMPSVVDDYESWQVHVPDGHEYELRLGMGAASDVVVPPVVGALPISAGKHRITFYSGDSPSEQFRYVVYLDGEVVIEKTMGSDWMPNGWSMSSSLNSWNDPTLQPAPLDLSSRSYQPRPNLGSNNYFHGQSDGYVTRNGYRLWIDERDRGPKPASPFIGLTTHPRHYGIGLCDGLRYQSGGAQPYPWFFTQPKSDTDEPIWKITAEFFFDDGTSLSDQTQSFQSWQLCDDPLGAKLLSWQADSARTVYNAFLQAKYQTDGAPQPVVELKWDASRPDEVGLRLADTPANDRIQRWRLRILEGSQHLWRELQSDDRWINADELAELRENKPANSTVALKLPDNTNADVRLHWQTDETLPLQVVKRQQKAYSGMKLYDGLPLTFGIEIPASLKPTCNLTIIAEDPNNAGQPFPSGAVLDEIHVNLDATTRDWIWLETQSK